MSKQWGADMEHLDNKRRRLIEIQDLLEDKLGSINRDKGSEHSFTVQLANKKIFDEISELYKEHEESRTEMKSFIKERSSFEELSRAFENKLPEIDANQKEEFLKEQNKCSQVIKEYQQAFKDLSQAVNSNDGDAVRRVIAADSNTKEIREYILSARDADGNTLLHIAASKGLVGPTKALVDWGADIAVKNNNHQAPVELAESLNRGWGGFAANVATAGLAGYANTTEVQGVLKEAQEKLQVKIDQAVNFAELPGDDVVDREGRIAKKRIKSDMQEAIIKKLKIQNVEKRKEWLKKEFDKDIPGIANINTLPKEDLKDMFKDFSSNDKKEVLLHQVCEGEESIISTQISFLRPETTDRLVVMFEGLTANDKKELLLQEDSKGNSLVKQAADQGNTKALDIMLKDLIVADKRKLLTQKGADNQNAIEVIIASRNKADIEWLGKLEDQYLLHEMQNAIDRDIKRGAEQKVDAYVNKDELITTEELRAMGREATLKTAYKKQVTDRIAQEKKYIADKKETIAEEGVKIRQDRLYRMGVRKEKVYGDWQDRDASILVQKAQRKSIAEFSNPYIKRLKTKGKHFKDDLKKEQAELGKQIRKDRLAKIFGGEVSGKTREELREAQKMLGRVIRSDQKTGAIDKALEAASNFKKKLSSKKGKSRG